LLQRDIRSRIPNPALAARDGNLRLWIRRISELMTQVIKLQMQKIIRIVFNITHLYQFKQ